MIHEDTICCEGCGKDVVHLIVDGNVPDDPNYGYCDDCIKAAGETISSELIR